MNSNAMKLAWTTFKANNAKFGTPRNYRKAFAIELKMAHQTLRYMAMPTKFFNPDQPRDMFGIINLAA